MNVEPNPTISAILTIMVEDLLQYCRLYQFHSQLPGTLSPACEDLYSKAEVKFQSKCALDVHGLFRQSGPAGYEKRFQAYVKYIFTFGREIHKKESAAQSICGLFHFANMLNLKCNAVVPLSPNKELLLIRDAVCLFLLCQLGGSPECGELPAVNGQMLLKVCVEAKDMLVRFYIHRAYRSLYQPSTLC